MKAIAATPGVPDSLAIIEAPDPRVGDSDVLVEVVRVGVCGTDSEIKAGLYGQAPPSSDHLIIGHESLGRVVEVGAQVKDISVGDRVVASVRRPCRHQRCGPCHSHASDLCITGDYTERGIKSEHGFVSQYYTEHSERMTTVPDEIEDLGVLLEPLSVVEKAVRHTFRIQERLQWDVKNAVVLGAGAIGLLGVMLLRLKGIDTYVFDRSDHGGFKSRLISQLGAHHLDAREAPLSEAASETGGVDLILEATGYAPLIFEAVQLLNPNGVVCMLGVSGGGGEAPVNASQFNNSIVLGNRMMFGSVNASMADFRAGVEHFEQAQRLWHGVLSKMITRRVPFDDFQDAFDREPHDIKVVIEMT